MDAAGAQKEVQTQIESQSNIQIRFQKGLVGGWDSADESTSKDSSSIHAVIHLVIQLVQLLVSLFVISSTELLKRIQIQFLESLLQSTVVLVLEYTLEKYVWRMEKSIRECQCVIYLISKILSVFLFYFIFNCRKVE